MLKGFRNHINKVKLKELRLNVDDAPPTLSHLAKLESIIPKSTRCRKESIWQIKISPDVILYIVDAFLYNELPTIVALSSTCRSLYTFCLPKRYSQVTLNSRNRKSPTSIEAFARFAAKSPQILKFIRRLTLLDDGFMFRGSRAITKEEECLCYILTRRSCYPNLKRLDLSFRVVWALLPTPVKSACLQIFALPSLDHISFHHTAIPNNILGSLHGISTLEMKGEVRLSSPYDLPLADDSAAQWTPRKLVLWDTSQTGFITTNMLLHESSGLSLSSLEYLEARISNSHLSLLKLPLLSCRDTLSHLELHCPGDQSGQPLLLSDLPRLHSLTLSADCSMMLPYDGAGVLPVQHFSWVVQTVSTISTPRSVKFISLVIRVREFCLAAEYLPWERLDELFEPNLEMTWPHLKRLEIQLINECKPSEKFYREGTVEQLVFPRLRTLSSTGVLLTSLLYDKMDFW